MFSGPYVIQIRRDLIIPTLKIGGFSLTLSEEWLKWRKQRRFLRLQSRLRKPEILIRLVGYMSKLRFWPLHVPIQE